MKPNYIGVKRIVPLAASQSKLNASAVAEAQEPLGILTATAKDCSTVATL